jgi:hypothetical protein
MDMFNRNARAEIVKLLTNANIPLRDIQAAEVSFPDTYREEDWVWYILYPGHTDLELDKWLSKMNEYDYYAGYGGQKLYGTIWLKNGLWMTRGEYDGSEWWDLHKRPPLPKRDKS